VVASIVQMNLKLRTAQEKYAGAIRRHSSEFG
jgi:hypothetical protein